MEITQLLLGIGQERAGRCGEGAVTLAVLVAARLQWMVQPAGHTGGMGRLGVVQSIKAAANAILPGPPPCIPASLLPRCSGPPVVYVRAGKEEAGLGAGHAHVSNGRLRHAGHSEVALTRQCGHKHL